MVLLKIYILVVAVVGLVTLAVFGWDKRQAKLDRWRIPEKNLHILALLGGWLGALAGMQIFRHKIRKPVFWAITVLISLVHVLLVWAIVNLGPAISAR